MTSVLALVPDRWDPPDLVGESLAARGIDIHIVYPHEGGRPTPRELDADGLVIMGGPQSVTDPAHAALFADMTDLVHQFHDTGRPVLGVCLGGQVVAHAFGAEVRRVGELQFGFVDVRTREDAASDSLFGPQPGASKIFCWHEDCFALPDNAVWLAEADRVPHYAFRMGPHTYGFQCHFEFTRPTLDKLMERGSYLVPKNLGARGQTLIENLPAELDRHLAAANRFGRGISDRWAALVLEASAERQRVKRVAAAR
ncbi:MAG: type 1 glutamine amidotransferase [Dongiaceae bacterium]